MYQAIDVAEYILYYYNSRDIPISNLKLQKILYFLQAEFLILKKHPLFGDDLLAWDFGPVVLSVYRKYARFAGAPIFLYAEEWQGNLFNSDKKIVNNVLDCLKGYSAASLTDIIHCQTPWKEAYYSKGKISNLSLYEFFKN